MKHTRQELLQAMKKTRANQRYYFLRPTKANLESAKLSERKTDTMLEEMQAASHPALQGPRMKEIVTAWIAMRKQQKAYFEMMTMPRMERAKAREIEVDNILKTINIDEPEPEPEPEQLLMNLPDQG